MREGAHRLRGGGGALMDRAMEEASLTGQAALVTGASGGIGQAIAKALAGAGAKVVLHYHSNGEGAEALATELEAAGGTAVAIGADLCEAAEIERLYDGAEQAVGALDIVVNNAGVGSSGPLVETDLEKFDLMLAVNFRAVALSLRQAGRRLREGGAVVNISSMLGDHVLPGTTTYAATKAAVNLLSRGAAKEFAERRISVTSLSPGATVPGMFAKSSEERKEAFAKETPLGRLGEADEIAAAVLFLVSKPGRWVNGAVLTADGGYSA